MQVTRSVTVNHPVNYRMEFMSNDRLSFETRDRAARWFYDSKNMLFTAL